MISTLPPLWAAYQAARACGQFARTTSAFALMIAKIISFQFSPSVGLTAASSPKGGANMVFCHSLSKGVLIWQGAGQQHSLCCVVRNTLGRAGCPPIIQRGAIPYPYLNNENPLQFLAEGFVI